MLEVALSVVLTVTRCTRCHVVLNFTFSGEFDAAIDAAIDGYIHLSEITL